MNKKFISVLMAAAATFGTVSTFTSCKDYDDDISFLQEQIDANAAAIKTIQELIQKGSVITNVASNATGVTVTLSDGTSFDLTNGQNGAPGTAWTIGTDGYWYKDGVKTEYYALGTKGDKGDKGDQGDKGDKGDKGDTGAPGTPGTPGTPGVDGSQGPQGPQGPAGADGKYYVPNTETGTFWVYGDGDKDPYDSKISFLAPNAVTAVLDNNTLKLNGVSGQTGELVISLSGNLTSLVFQPKLFIDGIETIEYKWLQANTMNKDASSPAIKNYQGKDVAFSSPLNKEVEPKDEYAKEWYKAGGAPYQYGPAWGVDYHLNPANANTTAADIEKFTLMSKASNVIVTTRAMGDKPIISKVDDLFNSSNGILTVGMQIKNPQDLIAYATVGQDNKAWLVALQAKSQGDKETITSDYAALRPTKYTPLDLVWNTGKFTNEHKKIFYFNDGDNTVNTRKGDMKCGSSTADIAGHKVYDNPKAALEDAAQTTNSKKGAALELYYEDKDGINIGEMLGIHFEGEKVNPMATDKEDGIWNFGDEKQWGLKYEFYLVDYQVGANRTRDSRYARWENQEKGILRAWNVKWDGTHADGPSASAVDREPLVQVLVKNLDGKVVFTGYILVHITQNPPKPEEEKVAEIAWPDETPVTFDLCNGMQVFESNWSEFHDYVLVQKLNNMTKETFDAQYEIDSIAGMTPTYTATGETTYYLNMYKKSGNTYQQVSSSAATGKVKYVKESLGTTNHTFYWEIGETQLESLTHHDQANTTKAKHVDCYVRYNKKAGSDAEYKHIYVKLNANIKRKDIGSNKFGQKIANYWYNTASGSKDAVVFDVKEPVKDGDIKAFTGAVRNTLVGNKENTTGEHKYYFLPIDQTVKGVKDGNEVVYTITAWDGTNSNKDWNQLICKYNNSDKHPYVLADLDKTLNECAINYGKDVQGGTNTTADGGVFENYKLYVKTAAIPYTQIATLDQATGEISLINCTECKEVLNAIGYKANHANLEEELRAWVGVVASTTNCQLAGKVTDANFLTSWQRPINLLPVAVDPIVDATTDRAKIKFLESFKLYDWRGITAAGAPSDAGKMWDENLWFWGYYNVNKITVHLNNKEITTNMNGANWKPLGTVTNKLKFDGLGGVKITNSLGEVLSYEYEIKANDIVTGSSTLKDVADPDKNEDWVNYFTEKTEQWIITYTNNGNNVKEFKVRIPVTVTYEWGEFKHYIEVTIAATQGN